MIGLRILLCVSLVQMTLGSMCIKAAGKNKCIKGQGNCDVASGVVCMDIFKGSSGISHSYCAGPQAEGCWCDPSLTSAEACQPGLYCTMVGTNNYKCQASGDNEENPQCPAAETPWVETYRHDNKGLLFLTGSLADLIAAVEKGAQIKVFVWVFGGLHVQTVNIGNRGDLDLIGNKSVHAQMMFWGMDALTTITKFYFVFSTSGLVHLTQFYYNNHTNFERENSNIMIGMTWFTRDIFEPVTQLNILRRCVMDGYPVKVGINGTYRMIEVLDVSDNSVTGVAMNELETIYGGPEFHPNETSLLTKVSFDGTIEQAMAPLNVPDWQLSPEPPVGNIEWFVDPCWDIVYRHDGTGRASYGSKQNLESAIESGKRIRLRIGQRFYQPNVIRQASGVVIAVVHDSVDFDVSKGKWEWINARTTGVVSTIRFTVGSSDNIDEQSESVPITWFVERRSWMEITHPDEITAAVRTGGADLRYSIHRNSVTSWYEADMGRHLDNIYFEREFLHDGTEYVQRVHIVQYLQGKITYQDFLAGSPERKRSFTETSAPIKYLTNAVAP